MCGSGKVQHWAHNPKDAGSTPARAPKFLLPIKIFKKVINIRFNILYIEFNEGEKWSFIYLSEGGL